MTTLYIDVFFLINFTVDLLAAFFAARFTHIKTSIRRLCLCSALGALFAVFDIFIPPFFVLRALNCAVFLIVIATFISGKITLRRRVKFTVMFFATELTIGGVVYFGYSLIDRYFGSFFESVESGSENKNALIFSILILLAIGVFKLLVMLFSGSGSERVLKIRIEIENKSVEVDALVDSGNLVRDPMNMNPVLFIKASVAERIMPRNIIELTAIDNLDFDYQRRIRLIPVTSHGATHVITGVRVDRVIVLGPCENEVCVTVAIDKEGGSYGGFEALMPSAAVENAL